MPPQRGQIDRRLEREHHSLLEALLAVRRDARLFRPRGTDAVPGVVAVGRPVVGEHVPYPPVDVLSDDAGPTQRNAVV